jgi:HAD superfamily hydrolase (TIGR01509 family)
LLEEYPNRKIILTNANDEEMVKFGLVNLPYEVFTLKHKPDKTNPEYFEKLLEHFRLSPIDVVYFEHAPAAVDAAKSAGIVSHYYDSEKKDIESLRMFLDSNLV